jgi:hypothetical protein
MLKLDLSGDLRDRKDIPDPAELRVQKDNAPKIPLSATPLPTVDIPAPPPPPPPPPPSPPPPPPPAKVKVKKVREKKSRLPVLIGAVVLLILAVVYFEGDAIMELASPKKAKVAATPAKPVKPLVSPVAKSEPVQPAKAVPAPDTTTAVKPSAAAPPMEKTPPAPKTAETPAAAKPEAAQKPETAAKPKPSAPPAAGAGDPVLKALDRLFGATPAHLWLTEITISASGAYEAKGMSFSWPAMDTFAAALSALGSVSGKTIPPAAKAPETIYPFSVSGTLSGVKTAEILDAIPAGSLAALADSVKSLAASAGAAALKLPKSGQTIQDNELPFEIEGTYAGMKKVLGGIASGKTRVYRLQMRPAGNGTTFNRIRASFSFRTASTI